MRRTLGVVERRLDPRVSKQRADLGQAGARPQHAHRSRVTEDMGPVRGRRDARTANRTPDDLGHNPTLEWNDGRDGREVQRICGQRPHFHSRIRCL